MMKRPECKYYEAKDNKKIVACVNCYKWVSVECVEFLSKMERYDNDRLMAGIYQTDKEYRSI